MQNTNTNNNAPFDPIITLPNISELVKGIPTAVDRDNYIIVWVDANVRSNTTDLAILQHLGFKNITTLTTPDTFLQIINDNQWYENILLISSGRFAESVIKSNFDSNVQIVIYTADK